MVLGGKTAEEVQRIIDECACSGLTALTKFTQWRMR